MDEDLKPFSHYDVTLGRIISDEKFEAQNEELIIKKEDVKHLVFEDDNMPYKEKETLNYITIQDKLESGVYKFIDYFNNWSIDSKMTKGGMEIFQTVFEEMNSLSFFGLNFDSNRHYEVKSGKYINDATYLHFYPNFRQARLMFYYDEENKNFKVLFIIEQKISSIAHNDTGYFHTITLRTSLFNIENDEKRRNDFFNSMMMLIKGNTLFTNNDNLKKILEVK